MKSTKLLAGSGGYSLQTRNDVMYLVRPDGSLAWWTGVPNEWSRMTAHVVGVHVGMVISAEKARRV